MTFVRNSFVDLRLAIGFFTRFPVGRLETASEGRAQRTLADALWAAPLAGLLVGALAAGVFALAYFARLSSPLCAVLALMTGIAATGALHEDGLADLADGFGGGETRARKLEIMKDSAIGTYGMLALTSFFVLRLAALAELATPVPVALALIAAHVASRALLPAFMKALPAARSSGLSATAGVVSLPTVAKAIGVGGMALSVFLAAGAQAGLAAALVCVVLLALWFAVLRRLARAQIGGHTGDVLGTLQQGGEVLVLLVASVFLV